ncbi:MULTISPECIES: hypothetical protein [unclassified Methylobacterium]|uniref:hypothetical protein n=1 Tax=unclassified Methylobacterium TaxID=2615210 RepID=UPI0011C1EA36|nr:MULTISPECIES: hypothetical protein [unclassified Methylobacterium]QEE37950.1 hypothetical protein FVA80_02195 [Methylobacterium sp. WL1]TXN59790.1 hypothetical protein FV241_00025 [Methylobacterium sp. WL2]
MPPRVMRALLLRALADADLVDQAKKALFYGKDKPTIAAFRNSVMAVTELRPVATAYPEIDMEDGLARLHAALGLRTEADEILRHELTILCGGQVDVADQIDEAGDLAWYAQLYANSIRVPVLEVIRKNVAKLLERFQGLSFSANRAANPDKAAEAKAQGATR